MHAEHRTAQQQHRQQLGSRRSRATHPGRRARGAPLWCGDLGDARRVLLGPGVLLVAEDSELGVDAFLTRLIEPNGRWATRPYQLGDDSTSSA